MKKLLFTIANILLVTALFAQAPEKMNYQAVARDLSGLPLISSAVNLQFDIIQGSASGAVAYSETQSKTTNQFGLFTAEIGTGIVVSGNFPTIVWGANAYFLRITVNGDVMPATQLLSVPYALYSKTSGGAGAGLVAGPGIDITGGVITSTKDTSLTNELQNLSWNTTDSNIINLSNGTGIPLASNPPTANDVLTWNGANWIAQVGSPWTLTGANIHQTVLTNNVGIGLAAPAFPLHVRTTTNARGIYAETSGTSSGGNKIGVTGISTNGAGTGTNKGGAFNATGGTGGDNYGVDARAVNGIADQRAVNAITIGGTGINYGIYSSASGGATNWSGYFDAGDVYISDNVGIGTTTPTQKLDVVGTAEIDSLRINNSYSFPINTGATGDLLSLVGTDLTWQTPSSAPVSPWTLTGAIIHPTTLANNIGIGSNTAAYALEIRRSQAGTVPLLGITNPTTGDASIHFSTGTGNFSIGRSGNTFKIAHASNLGTNVRMIIGSTGNVGFGVATPTARVHAEGFAGQALRAQNSSATASAVNLINFGGGPALTVTNGTVGINVAAPTARFHLNSTLRLQNLGGTAPAAGTVLTAIDANGNAQWQTPSAPSSLWTLTGANLHQTTLANNVGIGTASPANKLDVLGGINTSTAYHIGNLTVLEKKSNSILVGTTGNALLTGVDNTIVGDNSGQLMTTGAENTFVGKLSANSNTSGSQNVAIGGQSSQLNQLGWSNVAVGFNALNKNTTSGNTAIGFAAMQENTTGIRNTAVGLRALNGNVIANSNTAVGDGALEGTIGGNNTSLGYSAGSINTTGTDNTFVGHNADAFAGSTGLTNATAIGSNALVSQSNSLILGNNANVGIGTATPSAKLDVVGTFQLTDGNQAAGTILTSDATGNATWASNSTYSESPLLNSASFNVTNTLAPIGPVFNIVKTYVDSKIEITFNSGVFSGVFQAGTSYICYEIRIDGNPATFDTKGAIRIANATEFISMFAVFQGLLIGAHTVQIYAITNGTGSNGVILDSGGLGGKMISKETF